MLREIGRMDSKELARDASGARNYSLFLQELGDRVPETVLVRPSQLLLCLIVSLLVFFLNLAKPSEEAAYFTPRFYHR